jgi:hypothetical protein
VARQAAHARNSTSQRWLGTPLDFLGAGSQRSVDRMQRDQRPEGQQIQVKDSITGGAPAADATEDPPRGVGSQQLGDRSDR